MDFKAFILSVVLGICLTIHYGLAVRLTIQPNPATIGNTDTSVPPSTPQEVVIECTPEYTQNIAGVYSFYVKRNGFALAEFSNIDNIPKISDSAPNDIKSKNPAVEGSFNSNNAMNSYIRVRYQMSRISCLDEDMYSCEMLYKPSGADSTTVTDEERLDLIFLPGNLQITASRLVNSFPMQIPNQTVVQYNDDIEYRCNGNIGQNGATVFEWYIHDPYMGMFERFVPMAVGESIDDGQPSVSVCPYTRTSILRYRVTTSNRNHLVFRCEASAQLTTGGIHRAYSPEFVISPPVIGGPTGSSQCSWTMRSSVLTVMAFMTSMVNVIVP